MTTSSLKNKPSLRAAWRLWILAPLLAGTVFVGGCVEPNLDDIPSAAAGCEQPTNELLRAEAVMLPGRQCLECHNARGQADSLVWTAAGTIFNSPTAKCNTDGVEGVSVQLSDESGNVLITLTTNRTGNFFTAEPIKFRQLRVRISKDSKVREMTTMPGVGDCASCHQPGAQANARIYLN